ncbi:MAG: hypothetical protein JNM12_07720 [Alphaproteobacteria bacterium]|nr:hypothetical protein [Alphaproteobacteria bacterium]
MTSQPNAARVAQDSKDMRITASRLSTRSASILLKRISRVPEQQDYLLSKEAECCSRATD